MASKVGSQGFQPDSDVHVTFEDQQKINKFAKHNARLEDYKIELEIKKNNFKCLEEAADEIELYDEDEMIPFLIGEVFMSHSLSKTQELLTVEKTRKLEDIEEIEKRIQDIQQVLSELKIQLYHRFGSNISLESD